MRKSAGPAPVPYVSSLFRHLAAYPGLLPWAWRILRPGSSPVSGAMQRLAWQRVDVSRLPPLPNLSREALGGLGVDDAGLAAIRTVRRSFARVSPVNLATSRLPCPPARAGVIRWRRAGRAGAGLPARAPAGDAGHGAGGGHDAGDATGARSLRD